MRERQREREGEREQTFAGIRLIPEGNEQFQGLKLKNENLTNHIPERTQPLNSLTPPIEQNPCRPKLPVNWAFQTPKLTEP